MTKTAKYPVQHGDADRLLAQIVQSSDDAIISKTLDGIITSWNAAAERIFGFTTAEALGQHISILFPPDLLDEEKLILAQIEAGREIDHYETVRRHKDGREIHVSLSVAPIHDGTGQLTGVSKIARDISERRVAAERYLELQDEFAHFGRLNAMSQMSAAIAHELNQPLTAVANYVKAAQRLLQQAPAPSAQQLESAKQAMEKAVAQTLRAGTIIRYLRDFVEKRESEKTPEDLNRVIEEAVALSTVGAHQGHVRLHLKLDARLPPVMMDRVQIQQVFLNLVRNAMEAMADSPRRDITITSSDGEPGFATILVRDTGPGFAPEIRDKLFQPFVTTKGGSGMGIGLKICQSTVEAHDGTIRAMDDGQPGAAFEIRLPLA